MIDHCKKELPYEACGLLSGKHEGGETIWKMENTERSPHAFAMDSEHLKWTFYEMQRKNESLTGIYHSHPSGAPYPSSRDIEYANYPEAVNIIVSLAFQQPIVKGFQIINRKVIPVDLKII